MPTAETNKLGDVVLMPVSSFNIEEGVVDLAFSANDLQLMNRSFFSDGVVAAYPGSTDDDTSLKVTNINGFNIQIAPGRAIIDGQVAFIENVALLTVDVPDSLSRYDSVIIRRDFSGRKANFVILKGTAAAAPVPPDLTYNLSGVADFKLADILVTAGAAQLATSDIVDQRVFSGLRVNQPHIHDIGDLQLKPFRANEMPVGWYACNGQTFANTTKQAIALNSLPTGYKTDWGIVNSGAVTNVPSWAYTDAEGTRQPFARAVDGSTRRPGSVEDDAIRNITGEYTLDSQYSMGTPTMAVSGAFEPGTKTGGKIPLFQDGTGTSVVFNAKNVVPTAAENRPLNRGMIMAIYLGV